MSLRSLEIKLWAQTEHMFICIGGCLKKGNIDDVQSGEISFLLKVDGACIAYSKSQKIQDWIDKCGSTA
jgi:hypothetical protein